jgi:hypothetical protein
VDLHQQNALSELNKKKVDCQSDLEKFKGMIADCDSKKTRLTKMKNSLSAMQQSYGKVLLLSLKRTIA